MKKGGAGGSRGHHAQIAEEACTGDGGRGGSLGSNVKNGKSEHFAQNVNLGSFQKILDKMIARPGTGLGRVFCIGF